MKFIARCFSSVGDTFIAIFAIIFLYIRCIFLIRAIVVFLNIGLLSSPQQPMYACIKQITTPHLTLVRRFFFPCCVQTASVKLQRSRRGEVSLHPTSLSSTLFRTHALDFLRYVTHENLFFYMQAF